MGGKKKGGEKKKKGDDDPDDPKAQYEVLNSAVDALKVRLTFEKERADNSQSEVDKMRDSE